MATILLSAAGAAIGGSVGGTFAGLSSVAIGRAVGATLGRVIDQRLMGQGGEAVETGKVDRFRLTNAGEGDPIKRLYGRMRVSGHVIWASDFMETATTTGGGGKGSRRGPETTEFSYSVSLAVAVCEGEITHVGRVWADGEEVAPDDLNLRIYKGSRDQLPDPVMEAVEGAGQVPAYRGTAYVVMEDLPLGAFGNRVPQFSFEVVRPEQPGAPGWEHTPSFGITGVALIPGTGEYALATTPVTYAIGDEQWSANISTPSAKPDFPTSLGSLVEELPNLEAASLVVSWFGDDLRCGDCTVKPKVEDRDVDGVEMPWVVSGLTRAQAVEIVQDGGRPIYGGTPTDASVIEAIQAMTQAGKEVMYYPFILMDQFDGNTLPDPYSDNDFQPSLPWRGRITLSEAPGRPGSPDGTAQADLEVNEFFGSVTASHFAIGDGTVSYSGPAEWSFSRFILHNAALCAAAGGVEAFCIGSEMRGLTQIRGAGNAFPAVALLRALAAEARAILGPECKISYAADWSEYFGYAPQDGTGDRYFHLDPLWADDNIDFIGIDNYMPLSDWRDEEGHLDGQDWDAIYNLEYLKSNVEGGEGFDWFYHSAEARAAQIRTPITDGAESEPWVHRYKDIRSWWANPHHERVGGVRLPVQTAWVPQSKPIWFTEYGCAAVDKGTNQPNKFLDRKSSESRLPYFSTGARDGLMQMQYLRAMSEHWTDPDNNLMSTEYEGRMLDMGRAFVWTWDTRPYPFFPNNVVKWSDGENYARGHWINGRTSSRSLASVVRELCVKAGLSHFNTDGLYGYLRGYGVDQVSDARAALQPLMIRYGFDAIERDGELHFRSRTGQDPIALVPELLAVSDELDGVTEQAREAEAEVSGRVRVRFVQSDADFDIIAEEAVLPDEATHAVTSSELNMALTRGEGLQVAERWLTEARVARETVKLALPPSQWQLGAGDVIELPGDGDEGPGRYRIDRVEQSDVQIVDAVRVDPQVYDIADVHEEVVHQRPFVVPLPVTARFLDLPLLKGDEVPYAPYVAVTADPWPGGVAVYQSNEDADYRLNTVLRQQANLGETQSPLGAACSGLIDKGPGVVVRMRNGVLSSISDDALFGGGNVAAIGDGSMDRWEVFQFGTASLIAPDTWRLSRLLRGQAGSDALMPAVWEAGSDFVMLDGSVSQIGFSPALRRVPQHFRLGPAQRPLDDPAYRHRVETVAGNGARPLSPCHMRMVQDGMGGRRLSWIRRTRIDGDSWDVPEVPLGEESEVYVVRVFQGGLEVRETLVTSPEWHYTSIEQAADGVMVPFDVSVSQVSAHYGQGPAQVLQVTG